MLVTVRSAGSVPSLFNYRYATTRWHVDDLTSPRFDELAAMGAVGRTGDRAKQLRVQAASVQI